jgi:hypothetical protein
LEDLGINVEKHIESSIECEKTILSDLINQYEQKTSFQIELDSYRKRLKKLNTNVPEKHIPNS